MSDKKEKFLTRNYILMLLLNCIYGVSQNFITTPLAKQGVCSATRFLRNSDRIIEKK